MHMYILTFFTYTIPAVDIRRLSLSGGGGVSVVVRAGKPYLLKVELNNILPTHSRDVLETIRRVSIACDVYMYVYMCTIYTGLHCIYTYTCTMYMYM